MQPEPGFRVRNWSKFQHFKDRRPPWIKLYRDLLDDRAWHAMDGDLARFLVNLWMLASEDQEQHGDLPPVNDIAWRLRVDEIQASQWLVELYPTWLECDDIAMISARYQRESPRALARGETEERREETERSVSPQCNTSEGNGRHAPCPYERIRERYNQAAAKIGMVHCRVLSDDRKRVIRARWQGVDCDMESMDAFFAHAELQPFLGGENERRWRATIDWLMNPKNFTKVLEVTYNPNIKLERSDESSTAEAGLNLFDQT